MSSDAESAPGWSRVGCGAVGIVLVSLLPAWLALSSLWSFLLDGTPHDVDMLLVPQGNGWVQMVTEEERSSVWRRSLELGALSIGVLVLVAGAGAGISRYTIRFLERRRRRLDHARYARMLGEESALDLAAWEHADEGMAPLEPEEP